MVVSRALAPWNPKPMAVRVERVLLAEANLDAMYDTLKVVTG